MNICVYGLGGIGGSFGGLLCSKLEKDENHRVFFVSRGKHLNFIRENGLQLQLPNNQLLSCHPYEAHSSVQNLPKLDVVFICVKSYDLSEVIEDLSHVVNDQMIIIPLLNGFDIYERIRGKIKKGLILPSCVAFGGRKLQEGKCSFYLPGPLFYGADPEKSNYTPSELISFLTEVFKDTGIKMTWLQNPYPAIWQKYMFNVAVNLINAYSGKVLGEIRSDENLSKMTMDIILEVAGILRKINAPIPPNVETSIWELIEKLPFNTKSSYAVDIENFSKRNEGDIFGKAIIELGKKVNIKTSVIETVFTEINRKLEKKK
jgi:2-dehydropantoate 2-reductase